MKMKFVFVVLIVSIFLTACSSMKTQPSGPGKPSIDTENELFQEAEKLYEQKEYDHAINMYSDYLARYPKGGMVDVVLLKLGVAYGQTEQYNKALSQFDQLSNKFSDSPVLIDAKIETLRIYLAQGRFRELEKNAADLLEHALQNTQRIRIYKLLGDSYAAANDYVKAVENYDNMLQLSSDDSYSTSFDKIQSVVDHLDTNQTEQLLKRLSEKGIRSHLLFHFGKLSYTEKKFADAQGHFENLLSNYPDFKEKEKVTIMLDSIASGEAFEPYTLGCLLPLSGTYAAYGQRALQGVEMALIHFSQIIPDFKPKLIVKDTKSDPEQANKALTEMAKEGVAAIIGPMITAEQVAMTADALGVPILTLTQKDYITDSGPYVFRNFITPQMQVKALVNYAAESLGAKRFAILYPQENYGVTFMDIFWDEIAVHNGTIAGVESYHTSQTDFADAIKKLVGLYYPMSRNEREQALAHAEMLRNPEEALQFLEFGGNLFFPKNNPDNEIESEPDADEDDTKDPEELESIVDFNAVFIPDSPKKVGLIVPQLAYYDIRDVYLLGTNIWHSDSLIRMSRKYLSDAVVVDGFFVESEDPNIRKFVSNFKNIYSEDPEIISATAYDSALIILDLLKDPTIELRSQVKDRLLSMKPYNGLTGKTTFRPNGDVSKNLFILGIRSGRFIELGRINPYPANIQLSTTTKDFSDENKLNDNPEMIGE